MNLCAVHTSATILKNKGTECDRFTKIVSPRLWNTFQLLFREVCMHKYQTPEEDMEENQMCLSSQSKSEETAF